MNKVRRVLIGTMEDDVVKIILKHYCERYNSKVLREISRPLRMYGKYGEVMDYREFEIGELP